MKNISSDSSSEQFDIYLSEVLKCENCLSMLDEISCGDVLYDGFAEDIFRLKNRDKPFEICSILKQQERLDELNDVVNKLKEGGEAAERMRELDQNAGMVSPAPRGRDVGEPNIPPVAPPTDGLLDDNGLADNLLNQAKGFEDEAVKLREQAYDLNPELRPRRGRPAKKTTSDVKA